MKKILVHELENTPEETGDDEGSGSNEDNKNEKANMRSAKYATLHDKMVSVASDCDDVLTLL